MSVRLITAPSVEPVDLDSLKKHLRVEHNEDDGLILTQARAAREWAEGYTGRKFITQTWELVLDGFSGRAIALPFPPHQSVTSVKYTDRAGVVQTWDPLTYTVDRLNDPDQPARIYPGYRLFYPLDVRDVSGAAVVRFVAGYGEVPETLLAPLSATTPGCALAAIKLITGELYNNRELAIVGNIVSAVPLSAKRLLNMIRFFGGTYS